MIKRVIIECEKGFKAFGKVIRPGEVNELNLRQIFDLLKRPKLKIFEVNSDASEKVRLTKDNYMVGIIFKNNPAPALFKPSDEEKNNTDAKEVMETSATVEAEIQPTQNEVNMDASDEEIIPDDVKEEVNNKEVKEEVGSETSAIEEEETTEEITEDSEEESSGEENADDAEVATAEVNESNSNQQIPSNNYPNYHKKNKPYKKR